MKITNVEAIYVSQKVIRTQCDSGQDALIVKVSTDAGVTGIGEVDSAPLAVKAVIEPAPGVAPTPELAAELERYLRDQDNP